MGLSDGRNPLLTRLSDVFGSPRGEHVDEDTQGDDADCQEADESLVHQRTSTIHPRG